MENKELAAKIAPAVDEIMEFTGNKYDREGVEAVFLHLQILYIIGHDKSAKRLVGSGLMHPKNQMTDVELRKVYEMIVWNDCYRTYKHVDENLFNQMMALNGNVEGKYEDDEIVGCKGDYGLCMDNPVPIKGIPMETEYMDSLVTEDGRAITWKRIGSGCSKYVRYNVDIYKVKDEDGNELPTIYLSPYQSITAVRTPTGFRRK